MENLLKIEELPVEKAQRYGKEFLEFISKYCEDKAIPSDHMPEEVEVEARVGDATPFFLVTMAITIIVPRNIILYLNPDLKNGESAELWWCRPTCKHIGDCPQSFCTLVV